MPRAIVIGAGIGGLAAAVGLLTRGWRVSVFERAPELREVGAGLTLWPNALVALDQLGLGPAMRTLGRSQTRFAIQTDRGLELKVMTYGAGGDPLADPLSVHRAELLEKLLQAVGRDRVRTGATCVRYEQDATGVTAFFADGSSAGGELLIGADGLRSVVRGQLVRDGEPRYSGYTAWRGLVDFPERDRLRPGESWGAGARFGCVPLVDGRLYWFATANAPAGERASGSEKGELLRRFAKWHAPIPEILDRTPADSVLRGDIFDREPVRTWVDGRVAILGDAAHPMTPNLGQGACQALEDAAVLATCLDPEAPVPEALKRYQRARASRANSIVRESRRLGELAQWSHPLAVALRNVLVRLAPAALERRRMARIVSFPGAAG